MILYIFNSNKNYQVILATKVIKIRKRNTDGHFSNFIGDKNKYSPENGAPFYWAHEPSQE